MADGLSSLNSLSWGTSTGGAASSGESTLTLGVDRSDTRTPPDVFHVWGAQLNAVKNLALAMSVTFKGGTRLGVLTQLSSPFAANEQGFWIDNSGNPKYSYGGSAFTLQTGIGTAPTLATTYTGGASTADSIMALDSTRGPVVVRDNAATIGNLLQVQNNGATTSYLLISGNSTQQIKSAQGDGAGNVGTRVDTTTTFASGKIFQIMTNASERWSWQTAQHNVPVNASIVSSAQSATNTTALTLTPNVADGATSIALRINASTSLSSGTLVSLANAGTEVCKITPAGTTGVRLAGGSAFCSIDSTNGALLGYGSNYLFVGVTSITANGLPIISDGATGTTLGNTSTYWPSSFVARPVVKAQVIAAASSVTINPTSGNYARINLSATAISTMTISAGQTDGEQMMVEVVQDGTGSRTIPTTWTNVAFAGGTYTATATANKHDVLNFVYSTTLVKWLERARALNMS